MPCLESFHRWWAILRRMSLNLLTSFTKRGELMEDRFARPFNNGGPSFSSTPVWLIKKPSLEKTQSALIDGVRLNEPTKSKRNNLAHAKDEPRATLRDFGGGVFRELLVRLWIGHPRRLGSDSHPG